MHKGFSHKVLVLFAALLAALGLLALAPPATAADSPAGQLVSSTPAAGTPHVLDGDVYSVTQVGNTVVLGGAFSSARNDNSQATLARSNLLAFNANTGQISTTFIPNPNGVVREVLDAGDGQSVFVAGNFTSIGGVARKNLARVRISDGSVMTGFDAGNITGQVRDIALSRGRLWIAGVFTHIKGFAQGKMATLDPDTGARLSYMGLPVEGVHNGGSTQVIKFDITPDQNTLVAVGNFHTVGGQVRHQVMMLDIGGPSAAVANWSTNFYTTACSRSFDTYMRDIDFSPDGGFFVITTTGAYGGSSTACDTSARFETGSTGTTIQPSWVNHTGGDTTYGVEVTDSAVYVGGHFRWQNNSFRGDAAGQGAVEREGLAALDPINGLPYTWNPGRTRGVGVYDFLLTNQGLWITSDTDRIGRWYLKSRVARMPLDGTTFPAVRTPQVPNALYSGDGAGLVRSQASVGSLGAGSAAPTGGIAWNTIRGAFMLNGELYLAHSNGEFTKRTFDGTSYGAPQPVNASEQVVAFTDWRSDLQNMTGMFYDSGRIYFTRSGTGYANTLYYRYFTPESGVVGARRLVASGNVSGINFSQVRGMYATANHLYWTSSLDGNLRRINWAQGPVSGSPVPNTQVTVSGLLVDGRTWSAQRAFFLYQDANGDGVGLPPQAAFDVNCSSTTCEFDASGSTAPGGTITGYAWDFGDGTTGTGASPTHTFAASGTYQVQLTVTASSGTATTSKNVSVTRVNQPPEAAFTVSCAHLECTFVSTSTDPDGTIASHAWDFGDGATGSGASTSHTYDSAGSRTVTLTVTDNDGAEASATRTAAPTEPIPEGVEFVGAASGNRNSTVHRVTIPGQVQEGDTLLLHITVNSNNPTITDPAGWTMQEDVTGTNVAGRMWTRTATADDAGREVQVAITSTAKADLTVSAHRGVGGATAVVASSAAGLDQVMRTDHQSPTVTVPEGAWVVTYWAAKHAESVNWTLPGGEAVRTGSTGSGAGQISAALSDSGGQVPGGSAGGLVGATDQAVNRVVMFTTVLAPG